MVNHTTVVTEFLLLGFSDIRELQILHFMLFLSLYLATLMGNFLIIITVGLSHNLHSPMYFFLVILSCIDTCFISTTVPKAMANSLINDNLISVSGCVTQVFLVVAFLCAEIVILTVMAYDRYVAICHPLQYRVIMSWSACLQMTAATFLCSIFLAAGHTANTFRLRFCLANVIEQFFCDIPHLLRISCTDTKINEVITFFSVFIVGLICFTFVLVSYGYIFFTVFKIQSDQGRYKMFSTCIPHLTVFCLFVFTAMFSYMRPKALSSPSVDLFSATLYTVVPPLMNPIIYSLRNKEIQRAVLKMSKKRFKEDRLE